MRQNVFFQFSIHRKKAKKASEGDWEKNNDELWLTYKTFVICYVLYTALINK